MMLTAQEIFDRVAVHLAEQGVQSYTDTKCRYRTVRFTRKTPLTCAVGCLLPPERYQPEFDDPDLLLQKFKASPELFNNYSGFESQSTGVGKMLGYLPFQAALRAGGVNGLEHKDLLNALQNVHDIFMRGGYDFETATELKLVAEDFGLNSSSVKDYYKC